MGPQEVSGARNKPHDYTRTLRWGARWVEGHPLKRVSVHGTLQTMGLRSRCEMRPLRHWTVLTFRMASLEHRQALAIQGSPGTVDGPIPSWCRGPTVDNRRRPMRT